MSKTFSDFLSKGKIKKFKSGVKAAFERGAVKVAVAATVLASAFATTRLATAGGGAKVQTAYAVTEKGDTVCSYLAEKTDTASFNRLQRLVNNATKTETGREVIKAIGEKGTVLHVGDAGRGCAGFFSPDNNAIVLGAAYSDAELQSCLVHEGKHAMQNNNIVSANHSEYTFESNVMLARVMEADAMTAQTKFCVEMAQRGDSAAYKAMAASGHAEMIAAYEAAGAKYGANSNQTLKETMLSWYDDKSYVAMYDADFVEYHKTVAEQESGARLLSAFTKTRDAGKVLTAVCQWKGQAYAGTDGALLKTPRTAWLSVEDNAAMARTSRIINFKTKGLKTDKSADNFYALNGQTVSGNTFKQTSVDARGNVAVVAHKMAQSRNR